MMLSNIKFTNPEANEIVILHSYDYWIKRLILKELPSTTLVLGSDGIYVTPMLMARTVFRLRLIDWSKIKRKSFVNDLFRQISVQYVLACLDQIKARVVVSVVDNSAFFQELSRADQKRIYYAIQNGTRTLHCVRDSAYFISMTNFFCFGQRDIDLYKKHGHRIDNYFPVGSLVGSYYKSRVSVPVEKPQFDLCLVSQWHDHFYYEITGDDFNADVSRRNRLAIDGMNAFLLRFLEETGLSLVVCPRNDHSEAEVSFYEKIFGEKASIAESDSKNFSTYRVAEQSRLVVAMNSTMLAEIFSWRKKVLWCNVPNDEHYEMPEAEISYFSGDDYDLFKERVLALLNMPQEEYESRTRECAHYICNYDPANPPHEVIRSTVARALS